MSKFISWFFTTRNAIVYSCFSVLKGDMDIRFFVIIFSLTIPQFYSYTSSAFFTPAPQQKNFVPFFLYATPSDNPIAQIRAARRNNGYHYKKNNHGTYFSSLEHVLTQQYHTPYHQKRCKALDKTRHNSKRVKRTALINHDVGAFAQKYDIAQRDLTHTNFNHYEHQLHKEFLEQLSVATELKQLYKDARDYAVFIDAIGHGMAFGIEANHHKETVTATYWADVVWQTIDIAKAIGEGIGLGMYNTAAFGAQMVKGAGNVVFHPLETARTLERGIDTVLSFFVPNFDRPRHKINVYQELDALNERIACVAHHCSQQLSHMSLHNKIKFTTAFATEIVVPAKIFKVASRLCKRMRPLAAGLLNSIREEQIAVEIAGVGKISDQKQILHLMHDVQSVENAVEKGVSQGGKVVDKIKRVLVPSWIDPKSLATKFEGRSIFNGKSVHIDYEHLFSIGEMSRVKRTGHICDPKLYGWHHDYVLALEKSGVVKYENVIQTTSGAFKAEPIVNGMQYGEKTFFSSLWTEEHVIEKIFEVFDKTIGNIKNIPLDNSGCYTLIGETIEGLKIKIIFNPQQSMITTAYPVIKGIT